MIPIIMLCVLTYQILLPLTSDRTARGGDEARVDGLMAGADGKQDVNKVLDLNVGATDYLGKPFNARELVARGQYNVDGLVYLHADF